MTANRCSCGRPSRDAYLCTTCTQTLDDNLTLLALYVPELGNAVAGLTNTSTLTTGAPRPAEPEPATASTKTLPPHLRTSSGPIALAATATPVNLAASRLLATARNELSTWCRHLCETRGIDFADVLAGAA